MYCQIPRIKHSVTTQQTTASNTLTCLPGASPSVFVPDMKSTYRRKHVQVLQQTES